MVNMARGKFTDLEKEEIGKRISDLAHARKIKAAHIAKYVGVTRATAGNWLKGDAVPDIGNAEKLAQILGCEYQEIIYGSGDLPRFSTQNNLSEISEPQAMVVWDSTTELTTDTVMLPIFKDVEIAAGIGSMQELERKGGPAVAFSRATLRSAGANADRSYCIQVRGTSMEPKIADGCTIGIDPTDVHVIDGKVYAIQQDDLYRIKALYRTKGGYRIVSYNSEEFPEESDTIENVVVLGRVFWVSTMI